jgi:hypothetical protein
MTTVPRSVQLRLPDGWLELDPRVEDLVGELRRALASRWQHALADDRLLAVLTPLVAELRRLSAAADVLLVGLYTDVIPVDDEPVPLVVTASAVLAISPPAPDLDLDALRAEVAAVDGGMRVRAVTLPAGPAVLVAGAVEIRHPDWDGSVAARLRRYFIPITGLGRLATLSFLTPNTELGDVFDDVFDAIAETVAFE